MTELLKTSNKLMAMLGSFELVCNWWDSYNNAFGMSPWEMWFIDKQKVIDYVDQHSGYQI